MKNLLIIALFSFFCVIGADGDDVKRVMEGDSVTLDTDFREKFNHIQWRFGDSSIIAETDGYVPSYTKDERFRDRLELNHLTGSLTINNMRITDSGDYKVEIYHNAILVLALIFIVHVFGADEDEVKTVSVMEGDSVTLNTRLREKFKRIQWWFGDSFIAKVYGNEISYTNDERFIDRLKLNHQTGSLTINNMRVTDTGVYQLRLEHSYGIFNQTFMVIVYGSFYPDLDLSPGEVAGIGVVVLLVLSAAAAVSAVLYYHRKICKRRRQYDEEKTESTKEGESVALKTDAEKQTDKENLKLDHQTGSLKTTNTKTTDSGDSDLQIEPCSEGFTGKNANELETSEILLLSEEDPERAREGA